MLNRLFQRSHHVRRLQANPLGVILDQFADYLLRPGYTAGFIHQLVRGAEHYGYWLGSRHRVVTTDLVSRASAHRFLHEHLATCSCSAAFPRSLNPAARQSDTCCGCSISTIRLAFDHWRRVTVRS